MKSNSQIQLDPNLYLADVDGDQVDEFLQIDGDRMYVFRSNFEFSPVLEHTFSSEIKGLIIGDFTNNGREHGRDQICAILNNGTIEVFAISDDLSSMWWWFSQPNFVEGDEHSIVGDFDGDGADEILLYKAGTGGIRIFTRMQTGSFSALTNFQLGNLAGRDLRNKQIFAGDFGQSLRRKDIIVVDKSVGQIMRFDAVTDNGGVNTFWWAFTTNANIFQPNDQVCVANISSGERDEILIRNYETGQYRLFAVESVNGSLQQIQNVNVGQLPVLPRQGKILPALIRERHLRNEFGGLRRSDILLWLDSNKEIIRTDARYDGVFLTYWWAYGPLNPCFSISIEEKENWAKNVKVKARVFRPKSVQEAAKFLTLTGKNSNRRIRPIGSFWSFTDILHTNDTWVDFSSLNRVLGLYERNNSWGSGHILKRSIRSSSRKFVLVQAGVKIWQILELLHSPGSDPSINDRGRSRWGIITMGASAGQTLPGAISTGSHGGDFKLPPIADYVRGFQFIDANGNVLWIEPSQGGVTDGSSIQNVLGVNVNSQIQNDEWFYSLIVSMGSIGMITAILIEVSDQYGLSQRKTAASWINVKNLISEENSRTNTGLFGNTPPFDFNFPRRVNNIPIEPVFDSFEIFLNPYRTSDDYSQIDPFGRFADRACVVVGKARPSIELFTFEANTANETRYVATKGGISDLENLGIISEIENPHFHRIKRLRNVVNFIINADFSRANTEAYYYPSHLVRNTTGGDENGGSLPALGLEIAVPTTNNQHISFINELLMVFDRKFGLEKFFAGFISLRFTRPSKASLAPSNTTSTSNHHVCHIEIFALQQLTNLLRREFDRDNFYGPTDEFVQEAINLAQNKNFKIHWGQLHNLNRRWIANAYGNNLNIWRKIKTIFDNEKGTTLFSNSFTRRAGLESNSEYLGATQGISSSEKLVFGYDGSGRLFMISSRRNWTKEFLNMQSTINIRFVSPLKVTSNIVRTAGGKTIANYYLWGLGADDRLARVKNENNTWIWESLGDAFSSLSNSTLSFDAVTRGNRHDLFNLDRSGNIRHRWYDGESTGAILIRKPNGFPVIIGEIVASKMGSSRLEIWGMSETVLIQISFIDNRWHWNNHGNPFSTINDNFVGPLAVLSYDSTDIDVYAMGNLGNLLAYKWRANTGWIAQSIPNAFPTSSKMPKIGMPNNFGEANSAIPFEYRIESTPQEQFVGPLCGFKISSIRANLFGYGESGDILHISNTSQWLNLGNSR
ncbi:FAD-binding protein [Haliscomenobacter hydrossis]|uniref:FAD linked oxidase domain protein n=1 Tax=Haliscomenobacter hydrossis (strain ATCC 27775 / DSM 1100 / LMG 10767 / O) TaxID=760192 RepID=F4L7H1_HALH1|nr:FAD-binding protein [Haliscomenobacter hydrossis]AEE54151.1 FAD linked oxidase domain protein [Haliscomenobacter hydrossis DSM 1100]